MKRDRSNRTKYPPLVDGSKLCARCGVVQPYEQFAPHANNRDGRASYCRGCRAEREREEKARPGSIRRGRNEIMQERWRRLNVEAVFRFLRTHPCVDCGESDPVVLDFDHVSGEKVASIANLVNRASWERIMSEIEKCEVRCANCHRRKTAVQLGWYAYLGSDHDADASAAIAELRAEIQGQAPMF